MITIDRNAQTDAKVQIIQAGPEFSFFPLIHLWSLPSTPTQTRSQRLSSDPVRGLQDLASGDVRQACGMICELRPFWSRCGPHQVNVTMPFGRFLRLAEGDLRGMMGSLLPLLSQRDFDKVKLTMPIATIPNRFDAYGRGKMHQH